MHICSFNLFNKNARTLYYVNGAWLGEVRFHMVAGKLPIQRTDHSVNRWVGFYSLADGAVMKHCTGLLTTRHQEKKSERRKVFISFLVVPREKKNEIYLIAEVWQISFFKSQKCFSVKIFQLREIIIGRWRRWRGGSLKMSLLHVWKSLTKRITASFIAMSQSQVLCV